MKKFKNKLPEMKTVALYRQVTVRIAGSESDSTITDPTVSCGTLITTQTHVFPNRSN